MTAGQILRKQVLDGYKDFDRKAAALDLDSADESAREVSFSVDFTKGGMATERSVSLAQIRSAFPDAAPDAVFVVTGVDFEVHSTLDHAVAVDAPLADAKVLHDGTAVNTGALMLPPSDILPEKKAYSVTGMNFGHLKDDNPTQHKVCQDWGRYTQDDIKKEIGGTVGKGLWTEVDAVGYLALQAANDDDMEESERLKPLNAELAGEETKMSVLIPTSNVTKYQKRHEKHVQSVLGRGKLGEEGLVFTAQPRNATSWEALEEAPEGALMIMGTATIVAV